MKTFLTLLAVALSIPGMGQTVFGDSAVNCVIHWRMGEKRTYFIVHEKSKSDGTGNSAPFRFVYVAHISVIDSSSKSYTVKWEFALPDEFKKMHPGVADSLFVYNGMPMIFKISDMGVFLSLVNWEQVRDGYVKQMELSLPKKPDSAQSEMIKHAIQLFDSKETVESTLVQEIQLFHAMYGAPFTTREVGVETQLPNPFGGDPFPARQTCRLTSVDKANDRYTVVAKLIIDTGHLSAIIDPMLKKMNIKDDAGLAEARKQLESFNIQDFSEYRFVRSTGWVDRLYYKRIVTGPTMNQAESWTIEAE